MIRNLLNSNKFEKTFLLLSFLIVALLQLKSNLLVFYIPLLFCILMFGYFYLDKLIQSLIMYNFSFIFLTLNHVMPLFSGNQIHYLPSILKDTVGVLIFDYNANITYPYPSYKFLVETLIDIFGLNVLNILNVLCFIFIFQKKLYYVFSNNFGTTKPWYFTIFICKSSKN